MIEYILITAFASFINIYAVTAATEPNFPLQEPKVGFVTVSDAGESVLRNNDSRKHVF